MKTLLREFSQKSLRFFPVNGTQITIPSLRRAGFVLNGFVKLHAELFNILFPLFHFVGLSVQLNGVWSDGFVGEGRTCPNKIFSGLNSWTMDYGLCTMSQSLQSPRGFGGGLDKSAAFARRAKRRWGGGESRWHGVTTNLSNFSSLLFQEFHFAFAQLERAFAREFPEIVIRK